MLHKFRQSFMIDLNQIDTTRLHVHLNIRKMELLNERSDENELERKKPSDKIKENMSSVGLLQF